MNFSLATVLSAIFNSAIYIIVLSFLLRCRLTFGRVGIRFLCLFSCLAVVRLLLPLEFSGFTITFPSKIVLPWLRDFLSFKIVLGRYNISVYMLLNIFWCIGIIICWYRILGTYRIIQEIKHLERRKNKRIESVKENLMNEKHMKNRISIIQSKYISVPAIVGIVNEVILLPEKNFSDVELECILRHEISHSKYKDNLTKLVLEFINAIFWWNPLFYLLRKQIETILEFRADSATIRELADRIDIYMECIYKLYINDRFKRGIFSSAFCSSDKSALEKRFMYMLARPPEKKEHMVLSVLICIILLIGSFGMNFEAKYSFNDNESFSLSDAENQYVLKTKEKRYYLVIDGKIIAEIHNYESSGELKKIPLYE